MTAPQLVEREAALLERRFRHARLEIELWINRVSGRYNKLPILSFDLLFHNVWWALSNPYARRNLFSTYPN